MAVNGKPILIRFRRKGKKLKVAVVEKGVIRGFRVDDIVIDVPSLFIGSSNGGSITISRGKCKVIEVETLPRIKEKVLVCSDKELTEQYLKEIKNKIKVMA